MDARYIPGGKGAYTKIVSLEMAEVISASYVSASHDLLKLYSMSEFVATSLSFVKSTIFLMTTVYSSCKSPVFAPIGNTRISSGEPVHHSVFDQCRLIHLQGASS